MQGIPGSPDICRIIDMQMLETLKVGDLNLFNIKHVRGQ